jgi:hypothetical protein
MITFKIASGINFFWFSRELCFMDFTIFAGWPPLATIDTSAFLALSGSSNIFLFRQLEFDELDS